jgi:hypothetical protein
MFVIPKTVAHPKKCDQQEDTETQQKHTRNDVDCPVVKSGVVLTRDSAVNSMVSNVNQIVDGDNSYAYIADFTCDSAVDLMLGSALVFPTKHFRHLKVPVSEQEMAIGVEHTI